MTRFIKKCLLFLLLFVPVILIYSALRTNLHSVYSLDQKTHTLITGDSHVQCALVPDPAAGVQNVAVDSEGYLYAFQKLKKILAANPQVRTVILGFSYHNISSYYDTYMIGPDARHIMPRYLDLFSYAEVLDLVRRYPALARPAAQKFIKMDNDPFPYIGGKINSETSRREFRHEDMEKRIRHQFYEGKKIRGLSQINIDYLMQIAALCRSRGLTLLLLKTPLHPDYQTRVPKTHVAEFNRLVLQLGLPVIEFSGLSLTDDQFLPDGNHVNARGALLTTEYFMTHWDSGDLDQRRQGARGGRAAGPG